LECWEFLKGRLTENSKTKLLKYNIALVVGKEVRKDKGGSQPADDYTIFYGNGTTNYHLGASFSYTRESYEQ